MAFLTTPLDEALNSTSKIRLLRLLVEQDRTVSAREAARLTGMSRPAILAAIDDLSGLGLIRREESGRQFLCRANHDHKLVQLALKPLFRVEVGWPEYVFAAIREALADPAKPATESPVGRGIVAAWLFGSVARGRDKPDSDLDLFVLTTTEEEAERASERLGDALGRWQRELGADVRPIVMSRHKAISQLEKGNPFIRAATRDARTIVGHIPKELRIGQTNHDAQSRQK